MIKSTNIYPTVRIVSLIVFFVFLNMHTSFAQYAVTKIGQGIQGDDLNNNGQVVGNAFLWDDGTLTNLNICGAAVNDVGVIAGWNYDTSIPTKNRRVNTPFLWQEGETSYMNESGWTYDIIFDINNNNLVVGTSHYDMVVRAFVWNQGSWNFLDMGPHPRGYSSATAINDLNQVVGFNVVGDLGDMTTSAALWNNGIYTDLGGLGNGSSIAYDINLSGQVVGVSGGIPCLWLNGRVYALANIYGGKSGSANAINDSGQIVGSLNGEAVIWDGYVLNKLNDSLPAGEDWMLDNAIDINNDGQILATGNGWLLLLTPIPEPSTFWMLLLAGGVLGLVGLRSCSRRFAR